MNRPRTNSKLIVGFVLMLLIAYVILALALMCHIHELNQIQFMSCGLFAVTSNHNKFDLDEFKILAKAARKEDIFLLKLIPMKLRLRRAAAMNARFPAEHLGHPTFNRLVWHA